MLPRGRGTARLRSLMVQVGRHTGLVEHMATRHAANTLGCGLKSKDVHGGSSTYVYVPGCFCHTPGCSCSGEELGKILLLHSDRPGIRGFLKNKGVVRT